MTAKFHKSLKPGDRRIATVWALAIIVVLVATFGVLTGAYLKHLSSVNSKRMHAWEVATAADMKKLHAGLDAIKNDIGSYPSTNEGLASLVECPAGMTGRWKGPYVTEVTADRWGQPFIYRAPEVDRPPTFDMRSAGADGKFDTTDDIVETSGN